MFNNSGILIHKILFKETKINKRISSENTMSGKRTGAKKTSISSLRSRKKAVPVEEVTEEKPEVVEESIEEVSEASEAEEKPLKKIPPKKRVTAKKKVEEVAKESEDDVSEAEEKSEVEEKSESNASGEATGEASEADESEVPPKKLPSKKKTPPKSSAKKAPAQKAPAKKATAKKAPPKVDDDGQEAPSNKPEKEKMVLTTGNSQLKIFEYLQNFYDLWKDVVDSKIKPNTIKEVKSRSKKFHKENYQAVETVLKEACDIAYRLKISSPKFRLFVLHKQVWEFVKSFSKVYDEEGFKETALYKHGITNSTIVSLFAKFYVMVNKDELNIINDDLKKQFNFKGIGNNQIPEAVKDHLKETFGITGLPHSYSRMNEDMKNFLSPLIDSLNETITDKKRSIRKDVISRPQFIKILETAREKDEDEEDEFRSLEGDELYFHKELIEHVKKDEEWFSKIIKTYKD